MAEKLRPSIGFSVTRSTSGLELRSIETISVSPRDAAIMSIVSPFKGCLASTAWYLESQLETEIRSLEATAARMCVGSTEMPPRPLEADLTRAHIEREWKGRGDEGWCRVLKWYSSDALCALCPLR